MKPWFSKTKVLRKFAVGRIEVTYERRSAAGLMGRFGGGWDWKIGFQASSPSKFGWTIIFSLLVSTLRISVKGKEAA